MPQPRIQVARGREARRPPRTGGTQAPRSAARGPKMGLGERRPAARGRSGLGPSRPAARGAPANSSGPGGSAGATAPSTPAPTPWNTKAEQIVAGARRSYLNAQGDFDLAEREAKSDYGLDPGFNDYKANPYSRAALLEKSYLDANRGTVNSAGLQLYSGSTSNALGSNRSAYGQNRDALQRSYLEAQGEIRTGRAKAAEEKAEREQEAEWERIAAAEGAELDPEAAPVRGKGQAPKGKGAGTIKPRPQSKPKPQPRGGGGGGKGGGGKKGKR